MDNFIFRLPTKIVFGKGEFSKLGEEAKGLGRKALIVTGRKFAKESGLLEKAEELLQKNEVDYVIFSEIEPNPESETVDKGGRIARENGVDFIVGIGGGSVIDAAKGIATVAVSSKPIWDYCERPPKEKVPQNTLPILAVITVAATGSEADAGAVITNTKTREKRAFSGSSNFPRVSIVDPMLTLSMPQKQTIDGVVDMFVHILESYLSSKANAPVSDRVAEGLMREAIREGQIVFNDLKNIEARESLSWISTLALSGFPSAGRSGPFPIHRLEHPISGIYPTKVSHGRGLAILLPSFLYHTKEMHEERLKIFGKEIFSTDSPSKTIERIVHWMKSIDAFNSLKEYGVKMEDLKRFVQMALADDGNNDMLSAREPINIETVLKIYETAFDYKDLFRKA
jgi:alcohol dehydrogenase YqhD (iron-dependent ADH family)